MEESRAKQIVNESRAEMYLNENVAKVEGRQMHDDLSNLDPNTEIDGKEVGEHIRNGGWRLGFLIARNVADSYGDYSKIKPWEDEGVSRATWYRRKAEETSNLLEVASKKKISAKSFAHLAGNISDVTVGKYLAAWNSAAADGHVPHSSSFFPGDPFSFDNDKHNSKLWDKYFKPPAKEKDDVDPIKKVESFYKAISNFDLLDINVDSYYQTETHVDDIEAWFVAIRSFGQAGLDRLDVLTDEGLWTVET